jgi:hypothetical protein
VIHSISENSGKRTCAGACSDYYSFTYIREKVQNVRGYNSKLTKNENKKPWRIVFRACALQTVQDAK